MRERFARWGLAGLFELDPPKRYLVQIHEAQRRRWWGGLDPGEAALREMVRLIMGPADSWVHRSDRATTNFRRVS